MDLSHQAPMSMEFSRQEHWNGLPSPFTGDLLDPRTEPTAPAFQADSLPSEPPGESSVHHTHTHTYTYTHALKNFSKLNLKKVNKPVSKWAIYVVEPGFPGNVKNSLPM